MVKVIFNYNSQIISIQCNVFDTFKNICYRLINKINTEENKLLAHRKYVKEKNINILLI